MKRFIFLAALVVHFSISARSECTQQSVLVAKQFVKEYLGAAVMDRTDGCNRLTPSSKTLAKDVFSCDTTLSGAAQGNADKLAKARQALGTLKHCAGQVVTGYVPEPCKLARGPIETPAKDTLSKNIDACVQALKNFPKDLGVNTVSLIASLRAAQPCQGKFETNCNDQVIRVRQSLVDAYSKIQPPKPLPTPPPKRK